MQKPVTIKGGNAATLPAGTGRSAALFGHGAYWYATVIAILFVVLIGAGLIFGRIPLMSQAAQTIVIDQKHATGAFKRRLADGEMCRYTVYDNKENLAVEDRIARCDEFQPRNERRPTQFNWGK